MRTTRERMGLTQQQLATAVGIAQPSLSAIESDDVTPRTTTRLMICRALDLNPDTLEPLPTPRTTIADWVPVDQWVKVGGAPVLMFTHGMVIYGWWDAPAKTWASASSWVGANAQPTHIAPLPEGPR